MWISLVYSKVSFLGLLTATFPLCLHMAISFGILLGTSSFDMGVCPLEQGPIIWISCNLNYLFKRASPVAQWKRICLQCRKTGDAGLIPRSGKSPAGGHGSSLQCSCLKNPMSREAWQATVHRVAKEWDTMKPLSTAGHTLTGCIHADIENRLMD